MIRWTDTTPKPSYEVCPTALSDALDWALQHHFNFSLQENQSQPTSPLKRDLQRDLLQAFVSSPIVMVEPVVFETAIEHVKSAQVELGGLLLGQAYRADKSSPADSIALIHICAAVPAEFSQGSAISLTMQSQVWADANALGAPQGWRVVGWYHSHPGLTAFFSGTDRRTQAAFFNNAYSIGWVIDPLSKEASDQAWFLGPESMPLNSNQLVRLFSRSEAFGP
jgi:proteasome lid subunit RPN8/RPN11